MTEPAGHLLDEARELLPEVIRLRRHLHRQPEVGLQLPSTQAVVLKELERLGLDARRGISLDSVIALVGPGKPGPLTLLRADMDALPLTERTGLEFASDIEGAMHACGHDTHVAMLLGAARLLVRHSHDLPGPVLLMFQPGEEGYFGARLMLDEGLLDGVDEATTRAFAIHITASYPSGQVHWRPGPLLASSDNFRITVHGRGGHASAPHKALDPILVAAEIVIALQTAITREVDVFDPAVLTVSHIDAGTTHNIIPGEARLEGTYRTVSAKMRSAMSALVQRVVDGVCAAHGTTAEIRFAELYPVTVNDGAVVEVVRGLAVRLVGEDDVVPLPAPAMGAEDFSYLLQRVPGAMVFLGARPRDAEPRGYPDDHSDGVVFDEAAMAVGIALHAAVALAPVTGR